MRLLSATLWLFFCGLGFLFGENLRVGTYNVENYLLKDRWINGQYYKDYPKPDKEKKALRKVIKRAQPDILVFQELGGDGYLRELQEDLRAEGVDYPYREILDNGADRLVGVLSKRPFKEVIKHVSVETGYLGRRDSVKRGVLELVFNINGEKIKIYGIHLKSRWSREARDIDSTEQRKAEAIAVKELIKKRERMKEGQYVLLGDFNDRPRSESLKPIMRSKYFRRVRTKDSRGEVWTYGHEKEGGYDLVDYILVSPKLMERVTEAGGVIEDGEGSLEGSDHRLVYVDFEW